MGLGSIALATWNSFTMGEAEQVFGRSSPTGGGWTAADVTYKWRYQCTRGRSSTDADRGP